MNAVVDRREVVDSNNNSGDLGKVQSISNVALEEEEKFFDAIEAVSSVEEESDLGFATLEEEEFISDLEEREEFFDSKAAAFNIPLSIFHYKDYDSDFFTSWYNVSSEIFKEINRVCPEKRVLNLALSVLVLPYIAFTALGLVIYSRFKANSKTQADVGEDKTKKSETGVPKRLAYGVLAAIVILVNIAVLVALIIPATLALTTFYLLNRELSHSLVAALNISMGQYSNKHQNIEVSFHEKEVPGPNIAWGMEIKFPPQFKQLLRDLYKNKDDSLFTWDSKNNVLKLSANINLKNGLKPLRDEIRSILATSIQEFTKTMKELMKLEKKDITYDKLKELLDEFRLKVVDSIDSKLTSHLIKNAYQVAFIQAIKFQQERRGENFSLKDELENALVKQELESQGKELPTEKETIIKELKKLKMKEVLKLADEDDRLELLAEIGNITNDISDNAFPVFKAEWERLKEKKEIAKRTIIDVYRDKYSRETKVALENAGKKIGCLKKEGQNRYTQIGGDLKELHNGVRKNSSADDALIRRLDDLLKEAEQKGYIGICEKLKEIHEDIEKNSSADDALIRRLDDLLKEAEQKGYIEICEKLKEIHGDVKKNSSVNDALRRKLEDLFKFELTDRYIYRELIKSRIRRAEVMLSQSDVTIDIKQSLLGEFRDLNVNVCSCHEVNLLLEKMHSEITKCKVQSLFKSQAKGIEDSCKLLEREAPNLVKRINEHRAKIAGCLEQSTLLRKIIEGSEDLNKYLEDERSSKGKEHPNTKLIELHLENNKEVLETLGKLESEREGLLINKETANDYKEELTSREKIKFAIIENALLKTVRSEIFDEEAIKKLLEDAELEYYLAEKCIKSPVIKTKNNIKHFCQDLLSPLIDNLVENIINNVPKSDKSSWLQPIKAVKTGWGYIKTGLAVAIYGDESTEGKALDVAHDTYKEVETFLQHLQSSYEEVGALVSDVFSDDGETFKKDVWPQIKDHLYGMRNRFFKDIEFKIEDKLDEVSVTQQQQETMIAAK